MIARNEVLGEHPKPYSLPSVVSRWRSPSLSRQGKCSKPALFSLLLLFSMSCCAASITQPANNRVYQQVNGMAGFQVYHRGGTACRLESGSVRIDRSDCKFSEIKPGWYSLKLLDNGTELDAINVGVGDIYLVAGQSNAVSQMQPTDYPLPYVTPGRVLVSDYRGQGSDWFIDAATDNPKDSISWIYMAIALNRPYPIMIVNVAQGNTSTYDWAHFYFRRISIAWSSYQPKAILWHQGESDCTPLRVDGFVWLNAMVQSLREVAMTPWIVALNSTNARPPAGYSEWPIRTAQHQLIDLWPLVYEGPDTDLIRRGPDDPQAEFLGDELRRHGELWARSVKELGL